MGAFGRIMGAMLDVADRSNTRMRSLRVFGREQQTSEDNALGNELVAARARCMDARRNNPIAAGLIERFSETVAGKAAVAWSTSDDAWNEQAEHYVAETLDIPHLCMRGTEARLWAGELFLVPTDDGQVIEYEAERCRTPDAQKHDPTVNEGVRFDPRTRKPIQFCLHARDERGSFSLPHDFRWFDAASIYHVARQWRPDQVRCWPELTPAIETLVLLGEINAATLGRAKQDALAAWILKRGASGQPFRLRGEQSSRTVGTSPLEKFTSGMIFEVDSDQSIDSFRSETPNSQYFNFVRYNAAVIAACVGVPAFVVTMMFDGYTFATARAALLAAQPSVDKWRTWIGGYARRLAIWRAAMGVARGDLPPAPTETRLVGGRETQVSELNECEVIFPSFADIDPLNTTQIEMQRIRMGADTLGRACKRAGTTLRRTIRERAKELVMIADTETASGLAPGSLSAVQIPGQTSMQTAPSRFAEPARDGDDNADENANEDRSATPPPEPDDDKEDKDGGGEFGGWL
jgi:capsid protein